MDALWGELYLRSTRPFLSQHLSDAEAAFLSTRLPSQGWVLDVGCGHGRHLRRLNHLDVVGVDFHRQSLDEACHFAHVVQGELTALPFCTGAFAAAYSWYNTLCTYESAVTQVMLHEISRCIAPGGLFIVHNSHHARAVAVPTSRYDGYLPDGCHLREACQYDAQGHRDWLTRRLTLPNGRVMHATFFIRYYDIEEWTHMLQAAQLDVEWTCGGVDGLEMSISSTDLIIGARKRA